MHDFAPGAVFLAFEPGRLVQFTFGDMTVAVGFRTIDGANAVDLRQTGGA